VFVVAGVPLGLRLDTQPLPRAAVTAVTMPLRLRVAGVGLAGAELRVARGPHELVGTGPIARLAQLLPVGAVQTLAAHADGTAREIAIPWRLAVWLIYGALLCADPVRAILLLEEIEIVGHERLGAALDAALAGLAGDQVRHMSVLRAEILCAAAVARRAAPGAFTVVAGDMLVVGGAADDAECAALATPVPTPAQTPNWLLGVTYGMLLTEAGDMAIVGEFEQAAWPRFLAPERTGAAAGLVRAAGLVWGALPAAEAAILNGMGDAAKAAEVCTYLGVLLPTQAQLVDWARTPAAAAIQFHRALARGGGGGGGGGASHVLAVNEIATALPHGRLVHARLTGRHHTLQLWP